MVKKNSLNKRKVRKFFFKYYLEINIIYKYILKSKANIIFFY
ncbi:hypothetical protein ACT2CR_00170 [Candidatus Vidania fulgoroideorum]